MQMNGASQRCFIMAFASTNKKSTHDILNIKRSTPTKKPTL